MTVCSYAIYVGRSIYYIIRYLFLLSERTQHCEHYWCVHFDNKNKYRLIDTRGRRYKKNYNIIALPSTQWTNISDYLKRLRKAVCSFVATNKVVTGPWSSLCTGNVSSTTDKLSQTKWVKSWLESEWLSADETACLQQKLHNYLHNFCKYLLSLMLFYLWDLRKWKKILIFNNFWYIMVFMLYFTSVVNMMWFWFYMNTVVFRTLLKEREEMTEVTGRGGKRSKQLLNDPKEVKGYWNLKEEARGELSVEEAMDLL